MNMAVTGAFGRGHFTQDRPVNFGQLNSAIARGDLSAALDAFTALNNSPAPAAMATKARGPLELVGAAIASGHIEGARMLLADFRAGRVPYAQQAPESERVEAASPTPDLSTEPVLTELPAELSTAEQIVAMLSGLGSTVDVSA